ncbi:hypothetical protein ACJDU8_17800 [Clostridium sp. WILCCON 0269]|uniref:Uncharacterized protein n=1 Tax=Candidatus Clostridium eludens TaxID=3381663 RepID=A0ABW8SPW3_9CLOT
MFDILSVKYGDLGCRPNGGHSQYYYFEVTDLGANANFRFSPRLSIPILCKRNVRTLIGNEVFEELGCSSPTGIAKVDMAAFCNYPRSWVPYYEIEAYSDTGVMGTFASAYLGGVYARDSGAGELALPNLWISAYGCDTSTELTLLQRNASENKFIPYYSDTTNKYFITGNLTSGTWNKCGFEVPNIKIEGYSTIRHGVSETANGEVTINDKVFHLFKGGYEYIGGLFDKYGAWYKSDVGIDFDEDNAGSCGGYYVNNDGKISSPIYVLEYKVIKRPTFSGVLDDIKKPIGISTPDYNNGILLNTSIHILWINIKLFIMNWYEYIGQTEEFIKSTAADIYLDKDCYYYSLYPTVTLTTDEQNQIEILEKNNKIQNGKYRYFTRKEYNAVVEHINSIIGSNVPKLDDYKTALSSKHFQDMIDAINTFSSNYEYDFRIYYRNRSNAEGDIPGDKHCIEFKAGDDSSISYENKQVDVPYVKLY